jgi:hypothetical protein
VSSFPNGSTVVGSSPTSVLFVFLHFVVLNCVMNSVMQFIIWSDHNCSHPLGRCGNSAIRLSGLGVRHFSCGSKVVGFESRSALFFCTFCTKGGQVVGEMSGCLLEILIQIAIDIILSL